MVHESYSDLQSSRNYYVLEKMKQSVRSLSKGLVQIKIYTDTTTPSEYFSDSSEDEDLDHEVEYQSVEFIHESVRDYLIEKGLHSLKTKLDLLPGTPQYSCQFQLSRSCIGYLNLNETNGTVDSHCLWSMNATPTCDYALRDYAHFFWIHHVMKTEQDHIDQQDLPAILGFGNGTDGLPSIYIVDYGSTASKFAYGGPSYFDLMLQNDDKLLSTWGHWETFPDRVSIPFRKAWGDLRNHSSLPSILCLAGISSALREMRILKPDLYRTSERGRLLMYALLGRHEQIVQNILNDLHIEGVHSSVAPGWDFHIDEWTLPAFAVETGQEALLQRLLDAGADPNLVIAHGSSTKNTCLLLATNRNSSNMVRSLLNAGADPNQSSCPWGFKGNVPLHHAVQEGYADLVRALLESGADPNIPDIIYRTPLRILFDQFHYLSENAFQDISRLLLDHGADPNWGDRHRTILTSLVRDQFGHPGLLYLRSSNSFGNEKVLEFLLNNGAQPGIIDGSNISASEESILNPWNEIYVHKPLLDWRDDHGYTTWMCELIIRKSLGSQHVERFGEILERLGTISSNGEYDFNMQAHDGNNLLSVAVIMDAAEIVSILLKHQTVDPNLQDINGHTPLMKAADYGHKDIVKQFLDCERTAIGMVDRCGWTAFDWAVRAGNAAIATWLRNAMI